MKKIIILGFIFLSFFFKSFAIDPITKPQWFTKYKMVNATQYPIVVITRFTDYKTPFKHDLGLLINPGSNSNDAEFFDSPPLEIDDNSFVVFVPIRMNQQYIVPTDEIFFDNKDYTIAISNQKLIIK